MARYSKRARWTRVLLGLAVVATLIACQRSEPKGTEPDATEHGATPAAIASSNDTPKDSNVSQGASSEADAVVSAVASPPVWVQPVAVAEEQPAVPGTTMVYGDTIRTEADGLAQVDLKSGLAFRIGGDAALVLQTDNRLSLTSGEMVTWVTPGQQVPTEIQTPAGLAGLRGTTLFISVPSQEEDEVLFLAWEGTIRIQVADGAEDIVLQPGEELRIRPGEQDVVALRDRIRRLGQQEIRQRRRRSRLLNRFQQPLPTRDQIDATLEAAP